MSTEDAAFTEGKTGHRFFRLEAQGPEALRVAASLLFEHSTQWQPVGFGKAFPQRVALSTRGFSGIIDFWPEDLVARIGAGTSLQEVQKLLGREGLRVPATALHPQDHSLGALFSSAHRGWRSGSNRALRESVLGLTAIDGGGRVLKGGGRVMKNVAGYDLVRLHHGARGAFGVIIDLTIKLEALPQSQSAFLVPASSAGLAGLLSSLRLPAASLDPVVQLWLDEGACEKAGFAADGALLLQAEGWEPAVNTWAKGLPAGARRIEIEEILSRVDGDQSWWGRVFLGASSMLKAWPPLARRWRQWGLTPALVLDLQSGHSRVMLGGGDEQITAASELAGICREQGGGLFSEVSADVPPSSTASGDAPSLSTARVALEGRLKQAFDPAGLLPDPPRAVEVIS